jgi:hypothetical protein
VIGFVVPTLGERPDYLQASLRSIRLIPQVFIVLVAPQEFAEANPELRTLTDAILADPGTGLAAAINLGVNSLPGNVEFFNWLGDDDLVFGPGYLELEKAISAESTTAAVFGICRYIDAAGGIFGTSRFGSVATAVLKVGPNYIPQPATLFRKKSFIEVGGLDESLGLAFDLDMFLKLGKVGEIKFIDKLAASYRWHSSSLSSALRDKSRLEARKVRKRYLPKTLIALSVFWEAPQEFIAKRYSYLDRAMKRRKH